jgi:hypothetical protein
MEDEMSGFAKYSTAVAAVLVVSGLVQAPEAKAGDIGDALERACTVAAGRYEAGWSYDDQGVQWGRVATCTTAEVRLSCQDGICRATWRTADPQLATLLKDRDSGEDGIRVAATRSEFDRVLRPTAMY